MLGKIWKQGSPGDREAEKSKEVAQVGVPHASSWAEVLTVVSLP